MFNWFRELRARQPPAIVTWLMVQTKALAIAQLMAVELDKTRSQPPISGDNKLCDSLATIATSLREFKASNGWLEGFATRYGIKLQYVCHVCTCARAHAHLRELSSLCRLAGCCMASPLKLMSSSLRRGDSTSRHCCSSTRLRMCTTVTKLVLYTNSITAWCSACPAHGCVCIRRPVLPHDPG